MDLFGTAGVRGPAEERVTPELALSVARAAGDEADGEAFVVGRDGRTTGPALAAAVEAGLAATGSPVVRVGRLPTPALAFASRGRRGVMLTASHNPPADNGIKLFVDGVEYDRDRERAVAARVEEPPALADWASWTDADREAPLPAYREAVADYARGFGADLEGLPVAVDCGNGTGGLATPHVLDRLGAHVVTLNGNVDGRFPGRESKPTPESLSDLRAFVADGEFAFGVGHDGDADRLVVVGPDGDVVHEDTVLAVVAERYVRRSDAADPVVVTTPNASGRIDERVDAAGGRTERVRLGALHEGVARVDAAGGDVVFAAEPWKHVHPAFGGWIDGIASAAVFARLVAAEGLDGLRAPVTERPYRKENIACPDELKPATMDRVRATLPGAFPDASASTDHGVRLDLPDGSWLLVRPSGTEPYVRVYAESDDVDALVEAARDVVRSAVEGAGGGGAA